MAQQTVGMEFGLLGPLVVRCGAEVLSVRPGNQRALLAALLLDANQTVALGKIAEMLWGAEPPPSALATIRNYVKRLRQALGAAGHARISTDPGGYTISVGAEELDVSRFEALLRSAREAAGDGCWDPAAAQARAALELWRGEPLADVESDVLARREVPRLSEMRLQAMEMRIDADLHLGRHAEVVGDLQSLAAVHPLRERLHAMLMLALYRCGRQADALAAYQHARTVLVEDLGIEPGGELRRLHQQILSAEPELAAPGSAELAVTPEIVVPRVREPDRAGPGRPTVVPHLLPGAAPHFTGRAAELAALSEVLDRAGSHAPGTVVISAIGGTAGVGKTALAVRWAHQVAGQFPDGQLYVNLRGFGPSGTPVTPAEVIRAFLDALGVPANQIPLSLEGQAGRYRSLLAGRRMLIVLDNARDEQQVRPLLPAGPGCLVIVTSRNKLAGLAAAEGARLFTLDVLTPLEAGQMLGARLSAGRVSTEPDAVTEIAARCARLPLALAIAAARAAAHPDLPLSALAAELRDASSRLDALATGEDATDARAVLSWSYQQLGPATARMFRLLGLHPGPDITAPAAASLAGTDPPQARRLLRELTRGCLLTEHSPGRYALHDLLRAYATERAQATDGQQARHQATARTLDHYLHTAHAADRLLNPSRDQITVPACADGVRPERLRDYGQAMEWFRAEHKVLLASLALAADAGFDTHAWQIPWAIVDFCEFRGHWHDWIATQRTAITAARRAGHRAAEARCCRALGYAYARTGRDDEAFDHLSRALGLFHQVGDPIGEARTQQDLSWVLDRQGRPALALHHDRLALRLYEEAGHAAGQANALNAIGWLHAVLGDQQQAVDYCRQALVLHRELGNRRGEAATWDSLGYAHHHLGQHSEAVTYYRRSLSVFRELADRSNEAEILTHLGDACHAAGELHQARDAWRQALAILDELHHPDADHVRAKLGDALSTPGDLARPATE